MTMKSVNRMLTLKLLSLIVFSLSLRPSSTEIVPANEEGKQQQQKQHEISHQDDEGFDLPLDDHLSAHTLPIELSSSIECHCGEHRRSDIGGARIFYLVGIHNNRTLNDAIYLFRGIRDPRNTIIIHLDIKFGMEHYNNSTLRREIEECPCGSHVEIASVHNATWSKWSMNLPTFWAMEKAAKQYKGKWDVFINLSGDTLPVYTPNRIASLFSGPLAGINFISSNACATGGLIPTSINYFPKAWFKRMHYSYKPANLHYIDDDGKEHFNVTLETYFGSQWVSLRPDTVEFFVKQLERPDSLASQLRHYLKLSGKLMTDETFIPTILMHYFPETIPNVTEEDGVNWFDDPEVEMHAIRYERMDEHTPNSKGWFPSNQRYQVPNSSGVDVPKAWGPYFLGVYDLANIRYSGALYIRKVATAIDQNLFHLLPVDDPDQIPSIDWPDEVKISPKPNWEKKLAELRAKKKKELEKKHAEELAKEAVSKVLESVKKVDDQKDEEVKEDIDPPKKLREDKPVGKEDNMKGAD